MKLCAGNFDVVVVDSVYAYRHDCATFDHWYGSVIVVVRAVCPDVMDTVDDDGLAIAFVVVAAAFVGRPWRCRCFANDSETEEFVCAVAIDWNRDRKAPSYVD